MTKRSKFFDQLAIAVASGKSICDSAIEIGCSVQTAYNISATDDFKSEVSKIRTEMLQNAVSIITANATAASNALVRLLASEDERMVLAASSKLLDRIGPLQELSELRHRIDQLESKNQMKIATK